jgi:hypothetical protein
MAISRVWLTSMNIDPKCHAYLVYYRGATGAARMPGQAKTTIIGGAPPLLPPLSILQNQGKTTVLPVLPHMAPLY